MFEKAILILLVTWRVTWKGQRELGQGQGTEYFYPTTLKYTLGGCVPAVQFVAGSTVAEFTP